MAQEKLSKAGRLVRDMERMKSIEKRIYDQEIIIADREPTITSLMKEGLARKGFSRIHIVHSGRECLDVVRGRKDRIALLLIEPRLPEITGLETVQQLMQEHQTPIGVIFFSSWPLDDLEQEARKLGNETVLVLDYIQKPAGMGRVSNAIYAGLRRVLEKREALDAPDEQGPLSSTVTLCSRFHLVARQLAQRREERPAFEIQDEYDVQDLFHALLRIFFEDVRPEEYTPSYAGGASRMDFLMKKEGVVVEIKLAGAKLGTKRIGEQLIVDIDHYRKHPHCKTLVCFVYDPEGTLKNPRGLEDDLGGERDDIVVKVIVAP